MNLPILHTATERGCALGSGAADQKLSTSLGAVSDSDVTEIY